MQPIHLGSLQLKNNIVYAALSGFTDFPFRMIASQFQPGLQFCEMVSIEALTRFDRKTFNYLAKTASMHPIGCQIYGACPEKAAQAARIAEELGFDVVDLNCGCPVDKVTDTGGGSALLKTPRLIGTILEKMVGVVTIPVTVKIRAGWDESHLVANEITHIAESAGARAITIHGRTRKQGYRGRANWDWIQEAKKCATTIKVFGNGDVFCARDAVDMFARTGCDGIVVARGLLGQPWIVEDIEALQNQREPKKKTNEEKRNLLLAHLEWLLHFSSEEQALADIRRIGCTYFRGERESRLLRGALTSASSLEQIREIINKCPASATREGLPQTK